MSETPVKQVSIVFFIQEMNMNVIIAHKLYIIMSIFNTLRLFEKWKYGHFVFKQVSSPCVDALLCNYKNKQCNK